jgi:hypothetical protein
MGDDLWRKMSRWMKLERLIDRRHNRYYEHIEDPSSGAVIRHVDEPLADHKQRGSAKPSNDSTNRQNGA